MNHDHLRTLTRKDEEQARWRGQHFFMRLDEFLNQPGNACLVAPAKRVVLRHLVEKKR